MHELLISSLLSILLVTLCVIVHYETLVQLERIGRWLRHHRWMMLVTVHGLLLAHVVEIWIFGAGYFIAEHVIGVGSVVPANHDWFDYIYYSAMVYTTVGFGDLVPAGGLRMTTSAEALAGLSMITWSASFTFLQMQRMWRQ
ncbi:MAG: potassium channel family protein [Pseudomonadales bacterium]